MTNQNAHSKNRILRVVRSPPGKFKMYKNQMVADRYQAARKPKVKKLVGLSSWIEDANIHTRKQTQMPKPREMRR